MSYQSVRFGTSSEWPNRIYSTGLTGHGLGDVPNEVRRFISSWSPSYICGSPTHMLIRRRYTQIKSIQCSIVGCGICEASHDRIGDVWIRSYSPNLAEWNPNWGSQTIRQSQLITVPQKRNSARSIGGTVGMFGVYRKLEMSSTQSDAQN